jgi:predicted O-linked N-acetylglucosamine transferase (SPINDLY family)
MTEDERRLLERALHAHQRGDLDAALSDYNALLETLPRHAAILANRASIHLARDDAASAEHDARIATASDPTSFGAWINLGLALRRIGNVTNASSALRRASALRPTDARALLEWFSAAACSQQFAGIDARIRQPLPSLSPLRSPALQTASELSQHGSSTAAFVLLSRLRRELTDDAEIAARQIIETEYANAALLEQRRETDASLEATRRILQHAPDHRGTRLLRASVLSERGEASAAISEFRDISERVPDDAVAGSALLIALQNDPAIPANQIADEHRAWAAKYMPVIAKAEAGDDPERPLRIGWVSPRFFSGLVGNFFLQALKQFDRASITHVLYDNGAIEDATNRAFREAADEWHRIDELDDAELCERIRSDRIDVIVELSGHSPGNRLRALASRPARVQVNWLDYFHSTGTDAIDAVITDATLTPPEFASNYTEHVIWLPSGRLCYTPPVDAPDIEPRVEKSIRFCSFNRVDKLNDRVLASWSRVLAGVPGSILRLKARAFDGADDRRYFLARAQRLGITGDRLELIGYGDHADTMRAYADCDIALDPFPFSGCATSFDALWMGLPVVTKTGDTMVSRQTASILHSLDLNECVATTEDDYVSLAIALATDKTRLQSTRSSLRARMRERVCDVARHARELDDALREAWRRSCRAR